MDAIESTKKELKEKREKLVNKFENHIDQDEYDKQEAKNLKSEIENINQEINSMENISKQVTDKENRTKLYNASENLYTPSKDDIQLEDALTAIVDKPRTDEQREFVKNSLTSDNFELPQSVSSQIIDRVRKRNVLVQSGARTAEVDNNTSFITVDSTPEAVFHDELVEESADSGSHFNSIKVDSRTCMSHFMVSREMLQDSYGNTGGEALSLALTNSLSNAIMDKSYAGTGGVEPVGLDQKVTQTETYSGSASHTEFVKANRQLLDNDVEQDDISFIYSPSVWESLSLATDDNGRYQDAPSTIREVPNYTDSNLSNGTAYVGNASSLIYAFQMQITLEQFNSVGASRFGSTWLAVARFDLLHTMPTNFVRIEQA